MTNLLTPADPNSVRSRFMSISDDINKLFVERYDVIEAMMNTLVSEVNMLVLGKPGTAKSAMMRYMVDRITDATYWIKLFGKFTTPEEVFGPPSIEAIKRGEYRRNPDGTLRQATHAVFDEIFKASTAIRSSALQAINEKIYTEQGREEKIPLRVVFGLSNELPSEEEDKAFFDRFLFRMEALPLTTPKNVLAILTGSQAGDLSGTTITLADLNKAREEAAQVKIPKAVYDMLTEIVFALRSEAFAVSERAVAQIARDVDIYTMKKVASPLKVKAWMEGRDEADISDLEMLAHCFWSDVDQKKTLRRIVWKRVAPLRETCEKLRGEMSILISEFNSRDVKKNTNGIEEVRKFVDKTAVVFKNIAKALKLAKTKGQARPLNELKNWARHEIAQVVGTKLEKDAAYVSKLMSQM